MIIPLILFIWAASMGHPTGVQYGVMGFILNAVGFILAKKKPGFAYKGGRAQWCVLPLNTFAGIITTFCCMMLYVRLFYGWGRMEDAMPPYCQKPIGCTKVSLNNPNRCGGGFGNSTYDEKCVETTQRWCEDVGECEQPRARVSHSDMNKLVREFLSDDTNYLGSLSSIEEVSDLYTHAVILTPLMGFPDDVGVNVYCDGEYTIMDILMECRAGWGDFGVNDVRMQRMTTWMMDHLPVEGGGDVLDRPWAPQEGPIEMNSCNASEAAAALVDPWAGFRDVSLDEECAEFPYARPDCERTYAEAFPEDYKSLCLIYRLIGFPTLLLTLYQFRRIVRASGFIAKSTDVQKLLAYSALVICVSMCIRSIDPMGFAGILTRDVDAIFSQIGMCACVSLVINLQWYWVALILSKGAKMALSKPMWITDITSHVLAWILLMGTEIDTIYLDEHIPQAGVSLEEKPAAFLNYRLFQLIMVMACTITLGFVLMLRRRMLKAAPTKKKEEVTQFNIHTITRFVWFLNIAIVILLWKMAEYVTPTEEQMVSPREGTYAWPTCMALMWFLAIFLTPKVMDKKTGKKDSVFESMFSDGRNMAVRSGFMSATSSADLGTSTVGRSTAAGGASVAMKSSQSTSESQSSKSSE
jgi:hypothetical protein